MMLTAMCSQVWAIFVGGDGGGWTMTDSTNEHSSHWSENATNQLKHYLDPNSWLNLLK